MLRGVCKRIAALEASLREYATDVPLVAADIVMTCETLGERSRAELRELTDQRVNKFASKYGHSVEFIPHRDTPTCGACLDVVHRGIPYRTLAPPPVSDKAAAVGNAPNASAGHTAAARPSGPTAATSMTHCTCGRIRRATVGTATFQSAATRPPKRKRSR